MDPHIQPTIFHRFWWVIVVVVMVLIGVVVYLVGFYHRGEVEPKLTTGDFFTVLTRTTWCNRAEVAKDKSGFAPTSREWSFRFDGTFEFSYFSDYPEGSGSGHWSMKPLTTTSALLTLDSGTVEVVAIENGSLRLPLFTLQPCDAIPSSGSANQLAVVTPTNTYTQLINREWKNAAPVHPQFSPTSITFNDDGTFDATYRNGECSHRGEWSLLAAYETPTPNAPMQLVRRYPKNTCDSRGKQGIPPLTNSVYDASVSGQTLTIYQDIYTTQSPTGPVK